MSEGQMGWTRDGTYAALANNSNPIEISEDPF